MAITTEDVFLADICENPDDDAPRLIFADWLEDHGEDDRAEFIRAQIERSRITTRHDRWPTLIRREDALLAMHEPDWRSHLPVLDGVTWEDFSRGFVESAWVASVDVLLRHAERIFSTTPVTRLQIGSITAGCAMQLAKNAALSRLRELHIGSNPNLTAHGVRYLVSSPYIANLRALLLHNNELSTTAIAELSCSPHLLRLQELYLSGNDLPDVALQMLADARLPCLRDLDLRDNNLGHRGIEAFVAHKWETLETLYLVNNRIEGDGALAIAVTHNLPQLKRLYLNYNPLQNQGALALSMSATLHALRELDLRHCGIRDAGAEALARSEILQNLEMLWLGGNRLRAETIGLLRDRFGERLRL
jgi:uncharacterized protein (TIGR02996 family)